MNIVQYCPDIIMTNSITIRYRRVFHQKKKDTEG